MYRDRTIAVVVPAYNEETLIGRVIETMPDYVDRIVVVDDDSRDGTAEAVRRYLRRVGERLLLIQHEANQGVGGAIATGYQWCRDHGMDVAVVMAGDRDEAMEIFWLTCPEEGVPLRNTLPHPSRRYGRRGRGLWWSGRSNYGAYVCEVANIYDD